MRSTTKSMNASNARRSCARSCAQNGLNRDLAIVDVAHAEEVLEAALLQRIAFHVEEDVAGVRQRHAMEAAPTLRHRAASISTAACPCACARPAAPPATRSLASVSLAMRGTLVVSETAASAATVSMPAALQALDLVARDPRHLVQVIVLPSIARHRCRATAHVPHAAQRWGYVAFGCPFTNARNRSRTSAK